MARREVHNGCPPGEGTVEPEHGGRIGNPPHVYSEELAQRIYDLAQFATMEQTAAKVGISEQTLRRHYRESWDAGRTEALVDVKKGVLEQARTGNMNAAKVFLAMNGELKRQHEHSGPGGGPIRTVDMGVLAQLVDGKDEQELRALEQALALVLAATGADGRSGDGSADAESRPGDAAET